MNRQQNLAQLRDQYWTAYNGGRRLQAHAEETTSRHDRAKLVFAAGILLGEAERLREEMDELLLAINRSTERRRRLRAALGRLRPPRSD